MSRNSSKIMALACVSALLPGTLMAATHTAETVAPNHNGQSLESGTWRSHHENVLGTSLEIVLHAPCRAAAQRAETALLAEFDHQSRILSTWDPRSEFSRWQRTRGSAVKVSPELFETLARFDVWRAETAGALNPAAETASRMWQRASLQQTAPGQSDISHAVQRMNAPQWHLDLARGTATRTGNADLLLASFVKSRITASAADTAIRSGATAVMLNVGGDIVTRGHLTQRVSIADPNADAENDAPLDTVILADQAIATSGGYRRGVSLHGEHLSHLMDPRTGLPARHVLQATVIARDAETAGALATALCILSPVEAEALLSRYPDAQYLIVGRDGERRQSRRWALLQEPRLQNAAYRIPSTRQGTGSTGASWNQSFELLVKLTLPRVDDPRYRRPYVAVWIEDENRYPVRTVALWFQKPRWLSDLKTWYRDDRIRNLSEGTDLSATISSATRGPGSYTLKWDGKDNDGKLVKPGKYTVCVEAAREHGGYGIARHEMDFSGSPQAIDLPEQPEIGAVSLNYRKR